MDNLVKEANELTMTHFKCSAREFIETGVKKGRHYFYLRDVLNLTDKKFIQLMNELNINVDNVIATMQNYYELFEQPEITEDEAKEEEING